jgi:hypothetical protein
VSVDFLLPEKLVKEGKLAEAAEALVRLKDYVTFVELQRLLAPGMTVNGDTAMYAGRAAGNLVMWAGMSDQFFDLVDGLLTAKKIFTHPASTMTYLIDGGSLRLPLAKRAGPYKKPRWLPVCFRVVPMEDPKKKPARSRRR